MPDPALPIPLSSGGGSFRRAFRDALGRALTGRISLMPVDGTGEFISVPVPVELVSGVAEAALPPGTYLLSGILRTVDRTPVVVSEKVTL